MQPQKTVEHAGESAQTPMLSELLASDVGGRRPSGRVEFLIFAVCFCWALFQIYISSPLPFFLGAHIDRIFVLNETQSRNIHFAFATFLCFCIYPATRHSQKNHIPWLDWGLALVATASSLYLLLFHEALEERSGLPTTTDIVVAIVGVIGLLEASRRSIGLPLTIVSSLFIAFTFLGPYMPDILVHPGTSMGRMATQMWLSTEGVFGIAIGVSTSFVFMFVMFGSILERAGAGNYFIQVSFSLLGHKRGGPAKAAVVSSGLTGMISGSAIANIVTTGTFTIPLMKRIGFPAHKAAAVEVSSSINGQIMPPIMGAAAFLMTEFIGISYFEVIKHAFIPALISYIGLYFIVHIEATKVGALTLQRERINSFLVRIRNFGISAFLMFSACAAIYFGVKLVQAATAGYAVISIGVIFLAVYLFLLWIAARGEALRQDMDGDIPVIPPLVPTLLSGLYFLLPVVVLIWCLMIERFSPNLSIFWSTASMVIITVTHKPFVAWLRGGDNVWDEWFQGLHDLVKGMASGARIMVAVAISLAASGIIVGVVAKTGLGLSMTGVISTLSGSNLFLMLVLTALVSLILGMGLPTTANYIVVSAIMAPVVVELASQGGLVLSLISVHLFVFYFGIMSGTTPPVAVDAFAGAAIARSDPFKTSVQSFLYSIRTAVLPFIFVFNQQLILVGIDDLVGFAVILAMSLLGMLAFVAATQHYCLVRNRIWETGAFLVVALTLTWPGFWLDKVYPKFDSVSPVGIESAAAAANDGGRLRMWVEGENFSGDEVRKLIVLPLGPVGAAGAERLRESAGLTVTEEGGVVVVSSVRFGGAADNTGVSVNWRVVSLELPTARPSERWIYLPGIMLLIALLVGQVHRRRRAQPDAIAVS